MTKACFMFSSRCKNTEFIRYFLLILRVGQIKGKQVIKRVLKIIWLTFVAVTSAVLAGILAIQLPQVQTYITEKTVSRISGRFDGDIIFEKIHFKPFTTLVLKNVAIVDKNPTLNPRDITASPVDTLFKAEYIIARFTLDGLLNQESLHLSKAYIGNAAMNPVLENKPDNGDGDITSDNISRIFRLKKPEYKKNSEKEIFHIKTVEINNMVFTMKNHKIDDIPYSGGINWDDMEVTGINIDAKNLKYKGGIMSGDLEHLNFKEKSGWVCESITGSAEVGRGKTLVSDLYIKDRWSEIKLPSFVMSYKNSKEFKYFIDRVKLEGDIQGTKLDFRTLWYFAPQLKGNDLRASISGKVTGYVSDFDIDGLRLGIEGGNMSGRISGKVTGLPEIKKTRIDARLFDFLLTSDGLGDFISEWSDGQEMEFGRFAKGLMFSLDGKATGRLDDLSTYARLSSLSGKAQADIRLTNLLTREEALGISGTLGSDDLDIGRIIGKDIIGPTTLRTGFKARFGGKDSLSYVKVDSLVIDRVMFNGYDYQNIAAAVELSKELFDGKIICNDPNLNFMSQGTFALSSKTDRTLYRFYANIGHADLNAINIDKRGVSKIRLEAMANFTSTGEGKVTGNADIADIVLENSAGTYNIGNINITSQSLNDEHGIHFKSGFASADYSGTAPISSFIQDIVDITIKKEVPALFKDPDFSWKNERYRFNLKCDNLIDVLAFALPGLYVESGTSLEVEVEEDGRMHADLNSGRIAFQKQYLKGVSATLDNEQDSFNADIECNEIMVASLRLIDSNLKAHADDNQVGIGFHYDNHGEFNNKGEFLLDSRLSRKADSLRVDVDIKPSSIYISSKEWKIQPSLITIQDQEMKVRSFGVSSGEEFIGLDGGTSENAKDTLKLELQRFDISLLNSVLGEKFGIKGALTGSAMLTSPLSDKGILIDMMCDSTHIADIPLGTVSIGSRLNEENGGFDIALINEIEGRNSIALNGNLSLKQRHIDTEATLNRLSIGYVQPFLTDVFSKMSGEMSGKININGDFDNLAINSEGMMLEDSELTVAYTNVPYFMKGAFHVDSRGVYFDDISFMDRYTGTGSVTGSINWNNFKDFNFDTHIKVNEIEGIDLTEDLNEDFYGNIYGTGTVSITGPISSLVLNVDAATAKTGQLHIPVSATASGGRGTNLLKFTEEEKEIFIDPYEAMISDLTQKEEAENDLAVRLRVNANPDVEAFVEIDKASGNVLSGRGNGLLDLEVGNDIFEINGDYTLTGGNYKFVAIGLVSRDFEIKDGSSIRFNGDIMESTLNIDALYKTKASLSTLIADTTSVANRRTVECGINIAEKISNPRLTFSIEIPDLDPMVQSRVESALSSEDKVQKQFLSLLLSNSFLPDEQSGIVNNTTLLYSNVTEAMANQLNNIFQKLNIPLDLGLNYQPNEKGNDIFDVAVSTQLFNNRVVVNGSVGNKQYTSGSGTQDVVGDLDIEIKLDRSGSFRLNLFSHSADSYTNYLDNSQRNGVGFSYQTEFNSLKQFFRNMFMSKAKRQAAKQAEEQAMIDEGKTVMKIEAPVKKDKDERRKRKAVPDSLSTR